jgi:hypothetical protein
MSTPSLSEGCLYHDSLNDQVTVDFDVASIDWSGLDLGEFNDEYTQPMASIAPSSSEITGGPKARTQEGAGLRPEQKVKRARNRRSKHELQQSNQPAADVIVALYYTDF